MIERESNLHLLRVASVVQHRILRNSGNYKAVGAAILARTLADGRMEMVFTRPEFDKWEAIHRQVEAECGSLDGELTFNELLQHPVSPSAEPTQPSPPIADPVLDPLAGDKLIGARYGFDVPLPEWPPSSRPRESKNGFIRF